MTIFKTNALNLDELDIAWAELKAMNTGLTWGRPIYIGNREFQGGVANLQQSIDRLAMFDAYAGLTPEDSHQTEWMKMRLSRYDKTLDHSTHNLYPFVGKLEPRLARACINLAVGSRETATVVDPFCGSGTVLLEANLMSLNTIGGDIDPFAYWLTMMKLTRDSDEYDQVVKKLNPNFARRGTVLAMQRQACPPRDVVGWLAPKSATVVLESASHQVEAIVTSPPYYDAINYNERHAEIRQRLDLSPPQESTMGIDQTLSEYESSIRDVSQAMAACLAPGGKVVIVSAAYRGVDTPHLYEMALRQSGLRLVTKLKRAYRSPVLDVQADVILVMEKP